MLNSSVPSTGDQLCGESLVDLEGGHTSSAEEVVRQAVLEVVAPAASSVSWVL